ncbi:hypothetical protein [Parafilimonas sp.]|uniref:hypothetical protein n=1 Tax=Parafilimonas sp. TaxID=1969739 RepID=UPI0039E675DD
MKKHLSYLLVIIFYFVLYSCKKQETSRQLLNQEYSNALVSNVQKSLQNKMDATQYSNLDWANASIQSLDAAHPDNLIRVQDKTNSQKALYYSVIDHVENFYLVTINLPEKVTSFKDINGNIEIRSVDNILLKKLFVQNNKVIYIQGYTNGHVNDNNISKLSDTSNNESGITLPPVVVYCYVNSDSNIQYYSLLYTYGGGDIVYFTPSTPGGYGSGGSYSSPYWDKYAPAGSGSTIVNPFVDKNPNYNNTNLVPTITKYPDSHTLWNVTDNKTFIYFNMKFTFQLDKNYKLIPNTVGVMVNGLSIGTYSMAPVQVPEPKYGSNYLSFMIQGSWVWSNSVNLSMNLPLIVNINNFKSAAPTINVSYGIAY